MVHRVKILPSFYNAVTEGRKPFEIRLDDHKYLARPIMGFHEQRKDYVLSKRDLSVILTEVAKLKSKKKK